MDKKLQKNIIFNVVYHILVIFVPFVTAPYLGRVLGADGVGNYTYVQLIASYFTCFAMLGLSNYGNREIAKVRDDKYRKSKKFWEIYSMQLMTAGIALVVYCIYAFLYKSSFQILTICMVMWVFSNFFDITWFYMGVEKFQTIVLRNVIIKAFNVFFIFLLIKNSNDLIKYVLLMSISQFVSQILLWPTVRKELLYVKPEWGDIRQHFKPNMMLFLPAIASSVYNIMDKLMIGAISSKSALAYYEYSDKIIQIPSLIFSAMGTVLLSRMSYLSENDNHEAERLIGLSMDLSLVIASGASFGIAAVANELVPLYYGEEFMPCAKILIYLALTMF